MSAHEIAVGLKGYMKKDYQELKIVLNMKTLLLFEQMGDKSFYSMTADDFPLLIYCSLVTNNNQKLTFSKFEYVMNNQKIANELMKKCQEEFDFITQFTPREQKETNVSSEGKLTDTINTLILNYNMDINYVMYDLRLWELPALVKSIEEKSKADMVEKRFWTYMTICPHIDSKKIKSPEQILPFPWEKKEKDADRMKFMEENKDAIKAFFNKNKDNE